MEPCAQRIPRAARACTRIARGATGQVTQNVGSLRCAALLGNREAGCTRSKIDLQEQEVVGGELVGMDVVKVHLVGTTKRIIVHIDNCVDTDIGHF